jgi:predicted DsbA family dithiol-disulfide isomerase
MKVDIWSDIRCPFCYIGKRKFEMALAQFEHKGKVEVEWHSFELDPDMKTQPGKNVYEYLAERKGISREQSEKMHVQLIHTAKEVGLNYNFDNAVIANSFDAHRLTQLAKSKGLGDESEEALFIAYFTDGKDISDTNTLVELGVKIGLEKTEVEQMLNSNAFADVVREDEAMAQSIGVNGVPFFVLNNKYAVSGAQAPDTFLEALQQTWKETVTENEPNATDASCSVDGIC